MAACYRYDVCVMCCGLPTCYYYIFCVFGVGVSVCHMYGVFTVWWFVRLL